MRSSESAALRPFRLDVLEGLQNQPGVLAEIEAVLFVDSLELRGIGFLGGSDIPENGPVGHEAGLIDH
jgi:hypothetical protein